MAARSADLAFGNIARQLGFIPKERLRQTLPEAMARQLSLEQYLVETGDLTPAQWGQVIQIRLRFGRKCLKCGGITYLMAEVPPCEHCGGPLQLQPGDDASGVRGQRGSPSERVQPAAAHTAQPPAPPRPAQPPSYPQPHGAPPQRPVLPAAQPQQRPPAHAYAQGVAPPPQRPQAPPQPPPQRPQPPPQRPAAQPPQRPAAQAPPQRPAAQAPPQRPAAQAPPQRPQAPPQRPAAQAPPQRPAQAPPQRPAAQAPPQRPQPQPQQPARTPSGRVSTAAARALGTPARAPEPELATRTMLEDVDEFVDEIREDVGQGRQIVAEKPAEEGEDEGLPSAGDLEKQLLEQAKKRPAKPKPKQPMRGDPDYYEPPGANESGHFQFKTFSFNRSQLGLDAAAAEQAVKAAEAAEAAHTGEDLLRLAEEASQEAIDKLASKKTTKSQPITSFKIAGTVERPASKLSALSNMSNGSKAVAGGVAAVVLLATCVIFFPVELLVSSYEWHLDHKSACQVAKLQNKLLIEYTADPSLRSCQTFRLRVLEDGRLDTMREEFVWYKAEVDLASVPGTVTTPPPYLFVYASDGRTLLAGSGSAGELSAGDVERLLREAKALAAGGGPRRRPSEDDADDGSAEVPGDGGGD